VEEEVVTIAATPAAGVIVAIIAGKTIVPIALCPPCHLWWLARDEKEGPAAPNGAAGPSFSSRARP